VIVCILSVDTPVLRQRKEEKRKGQEGTLWIGGWVVTAPNTWPGYAAQGDGGGCGVKLWGEAARDWGEGVVRKGDVVLLESKFSSVNLAKARLVAWYLHGRADTCNRCNIQTSPRRPIGSNLNIFNSTI